jgi:integrase
MARGDGRVYQRKGTARWWIQYSVRGKQYREPGGRSEAEARKRLRARQAEIEDRRFVGPTVERLKVLAVLDAYALRMENLGRRSLRTTKAHMLPLRRAFADLRVSELSAAAIEAFKRARLDQGRAPATVNRELEVLRGALRLAKLPPTMVPDIEMLPVENARTGFFTMAEVLALLRAMTDADVRDFVQWAFLTGMRRGEIARLDWSMLDRSSTPWVLRIPGTITKNQKGRSFGVDGEAKLLLERRLRARRFDCGLIFHRTGVVMGQFRKPWRTALRRAGLPPGRLFHDLRRSAVRNLIRSGIDPSIAMKVSGHKTRSMLDRYNVIEETETASALRTADAWLAQQPTERNVVPVAVGDSSGPERRVTTDGVWRRGWDSNPRYP